MDARSIFWEIHAGLPRQAPGSDATTRRLLSLCGLLPPAPGYAVVDTYRLPASDWAASYDPIAERLDAYDTTDPEVAAAERAELDLYRDHGDEYGYTGYVLRRAD